MPRYLMWINSFEALRIEAVYDTAVSFYGNLCELDMECDRGKNVVGKRWVAVGGGWCVEVALIWQKNIGRESPNRVRDSLSLQVD